MKYDTDLYQWTIEQADALRRRAVNELDYDNLADEIESVGRSERREIRSRLEILLIHLLKWRYQPEKQSAGKQSDSWRASVSEARQRIEDVLADNPSLRSFPAEALASAYRLAIIDNAIRRLELLHLPDACPWAIEDVLRDDFWP
jgi:uncharacterized protein DUF29